MMRSLGRNCGRACIALVCLLLTSGGAIAQTQEQQHWQAAQNYPANSPPNYQPSNNSADPPATPAAGYPPANPAGNPATGQNQGGQSQPGQNPNQYPPAYPPAGPQQYPQYPTIEQRPAAPAGQQPSGSPSKLPPGAAPADPALSPAESGAYPQYPRMQGNPREQVQGQPSAGQQMQGPPMRNDAPKAPFVLSTAEARALENLLTDWEKRNKEIHVLWSKFYRWKYDAVFGNGGQAPAYEEGELKFAAPDKGLMLIKAKDPKQSEQWLCDGKSIFQFDYRQSIVTEYVMPPELQGKGIGDGPLPFVFGIEAEKLKQRYFMRIITPPNVQDAVWLEAQPRYRQQAAEFSKVEVILKIAGPTKSLLPFAINVYAPNGKDHIVYQLQDPQINPRTGWFPQLGGNWWQASIPFGWKKKTELPPPPIQAGLVPSNPQRR
jgi:TIGR03009 family protein